MKLIETARLVELKLKQSALVGKKRMPKSKIVIRPNNF